MGTENKMQVTDRRYDVVLLDVDGTLLDFKLSEKLGMEHVMRAFGVEPTKERLELYHEINEGFWSAFERGEVTKERLVWERFNVFFARLGITVDGHATENLYRRQLDDSAFLIDGGSQKPQKEYFEYCFKRIPGVCPERMLLVGDSLSSDIKGGQAAGTATCWYNPSGLINRTGIRPDLEICALGELKRIL